MNNLAPFQLLEVNVISAQDLEPICRRKMRTYAVAWVHSERKLSTRIDTQGHTNPTWNDKFIFRIDDEFLYSNTSAIMIEIYAVHWFRDIHVGTVRAIIGNLIPRISSKLNRCQEVPLGMSFVALQVWRPSGRPQGILNIGVALLDSSMRSMPLYLQMGSSSVGYKHLMGEEDPYLVSASTKSNNNDNHQLLLNTLIKPELRRTKSDSSSIFASDLLPRKSVKGSSIINGGSVFNGGGSMVNGSKTEKNNNKVNSRGSSMVNYTFAKINLKKGKSSLVVNRFDDPRKEGINGQKIGLKAPSGKSLNGLRYNGLDYGAQKKLGGAKVWTDSELGPSPSEVATTMAKNMHLNIFDDAESSILGWSLDDQSIEGLRSKLERWRTELPPVYDQSGEASSSLSGIPISKRTRHVRRHTDNDGSFSCFGNICGCEISISCGGGEATTTRKKGNLHRSPPNSVAYGMSYI